MKIVYKLFLLVLIVSCSSSKKNIESNLNLNSTNFLKIVKDSLIIITPYIEIKEKSKAHFILHPEKRKLLTEFTLNTIKLEFSNSKYVEIPFLSRDYSTINSAIERKVSYRRQKAPAELLIDNNNYSVFISINGYFGEINRGVLMLFLINNEKKTWKLIQREIYGNSPLELKKIRVKILRALNKL